MLQGQFLGGMGNGTAHSALANVDPCSYFFGDTLSGFTVTQLPNPDPCDYFLGDTFPRFVVKVLPNPDSCGFFWGDTLSGFNAQTLANPDSCGLFEGTNADGFALAIMASTVACPTFYGTNADGFASATSACLPLEVTATDLQGRMTGPNAFLWWNTFSEINNLGFILQRSENLVEWKEIAFLEGSDRSNSLRKYLHTDEEKPFGISYYRWTQVDLDGANSRSNVVSLLRMDETVDQSLWLYPVPVERNDVLHLVYSAPDSGIVSVRIIDLQGKIVLENEFNKINFNMQANFQIENISVGAYLMIVDQLGKRSVKRFFVF